MNEAQDRFKKVYERALTALRVGEPAQAEHQLRAIQAALPGEINSLRLLGLALLAQQKTFAAVATLARAVAAAPDFALARADLARGYRNAGRTEQAYTEIRAVLTRAPALGSAWLTYGDVLVDMQQYSAAAIAYRRSRRADPHAARLTAARRAYADGRHEDAETAFREILGVDASHVGALCGLAAVFIGTGMAFEAERLLRHALNQTAHSPLVWGLLGQALLESGRISEAEMATRRALLVEPKNVQNWIALGAVAARLLQPDKALMAYREAERLDPRQPLVHLSIGHVLKTLGRRAECERVYRECIARGVDSEEAYWSLADLKNYQFTDAEIAAMEDRLSGGASDAEAALLHFALGRAREQQGGTTKAFFHYREGNRLRAQRSPFDLAGYESKCRRVMARLGAAYFAGVESAGCADAAPIFIVGLPRSGSTLVEQILASHPSVEGTMELPNVPSYVREFDRLNARLDAYPESFELAPHAVLAALGQRYIEETSALRRGLPRFIDKLPNNFTHIGLIHAILPNATIIDVRRHPMDACFSCFKQYFASGQAFTYDLQCLGRYYRCYLELMNHWDAALPGKVLHLSYEDLVTAPDANIRRLLAHCGLEFNPRCLQFHETQRPIRTSSSEQVRQPLYASGVGYWRRFEGELQPLAQSLGDCVERHRSVEAWRLPD
jgi:tetratricopeptide (TPR) repeat protein